MLVNTHHVSFAQFHVHNHSRDGVSACMYKRVCKIQERRRERKRWEVESSPGKAHQNYVMLNSVLKAEDLEHHARERTLLTFNIYIHSPQCRGDVKIARIYHVCFAILYAYLCFIRTVDSQVAKSTLLLNAHLIVVKIK